MKSPETGLDYIRRSNSPQLRHSVWPENDSYLYDEVLSSAIFYSSIPVLISSAISRLNGDVSGSKTLLTGGLLIAGYSIVKSFYNYIEWVDGYYRPKKY